MKYPAYRRVLIALLLASSVSAIGCTPSAVLRQTSSPTADEAHESAGSVVLVHGMGRTRYSMIPLARALEAEGYEVVNWGYSSVCCSIAELGRKLSDELILRFGSDSRPVHFVGHSLGNIIVRWVIASDPEVQIGRVVMLAPPNQGSQQADLLAPLLGWLLEPLSELRTDRRSTARNLVLPDGIEVGIIAGRDDGKVTEGETHLSGEADHTVVPAVHSFLMFRDDVQTLTIDFLRRGSFEVCPAAAPAPADEIC